MAALTVQHHWYNADPTKGSQVVEEEVEEITQKSGILSDTPQLTTVRIGTIVEKMKYDLSEFTVKPGKTWEKESKRAGKLMFTETIQEYRDQNGELVITSRGVGVKTERPVDQS